MISETKIDKPTVHSLAKSAVEAYTKDKSYSSLSAALSDVLGKIPYNYEQVSRITQAANQRLWDKLSSEQDPSEVRFEPAEVEKVLVGMGRDAFRPDPPMGAKMASNKADRISGGEFTKRAEELLLSKEAVTEEVNKYWRTRRARRKGSVAPATNPPSKIRSSKDALTMRANKRASEMVYRWDQIAAEVRSARQKIADQIADAEHEFQSTLWALEKVSSKMCYLGTSKGDIVGAVKDAVGGDTGSALIAWLEKSGRITRDTRSDDWFEGVARADEDFYPRTGGGSKQSEKSAASRVLNASHPLVVLAKKAHEQRELAGVLSLAEDRLTDLLSSVESFALKGEKVSCY